MGAARITNEASEAITLPNNAKARVTQTAVESVQAPTDPRFCRVTQLAVETVTTQVYADPCENPFSIPAMDPYPLVALGGPYQLFFQELEPEWKPYFNDYADKGRDANVNAAKTRRFILEYDGLSLAEAQILDAHYEMAQTTFGFTLTVPRTAEMITGVRYEAFEAPDHEKVWSLRRSVRLIKYP